MKLQDIILRVQRSFGDDVQSQITIEDIVRWANDACLEIATANTVSSLSLKGSSSIEAGKQDYVLPEDLLRLHIVKANGFKLAKTTLDQLSELDDTDTSVGKPAVYYTYENKLYLYPTPSETLGNLDIYYVKVPSKLVETNLEAVPDIPVSYHPRIVEYCIAQAAELDDNLGQYQMKMSQFKENLLSLKGNGEQVESESYYPSITYIGEEW